MGNLKLIVMNNMKEFGEKVNVHLKKLTNSEEDLIIPIDEVRFNNGEGKVVLKESVRKKDIYVLSDIGNHSITYKMYDYINHKSPDDHYVDITRVLCAIRNQSDATSLVMPLLYASRQHKRDGRESLDCAQALQEFVHQGVKNIITFDVHDSNVQNAIPRSSFDNFYPTNILLEKFVTTEDVDNNNLLAVSPDNGALKRTRFYANMLGCSLGGHFEKHRDVYSFRSRKEYSVNDINNLQNIGFFEIFEKTINSNNKKGILPNINGIESIECLNCGAMQRADTNTAIFDIQIQIIYREEA